MSSSGNKIKITFWLEYFSWTVKTQNIQTLQKHSVVYLDLMSFGNWALIIFCRTPLLRAYLYNCWGFFSLFLYLLICQRLRLKPPNPSQSFHLINYFNYKTEYTVCSATSDSEIVTVLVKLRELESNLAFIAVPLWSLYVHVYTEGVRH